MYTYNSVYCNNIIINTHGRQRRRQNAYIFHYLNLKINTFGTKQMFYNGFGLYCCREWTKAQPSVGPQFIMEVQMKAVQAITPVYTRRKRISGGTPDLPVSRFFSPIVIFSPPSANNIPRQNSIKTLRLWRSTAAEKFSFSYIYIFFLADFNLRPWLYAVLMFSVSPRMCIIHGSVCPRVIRNGLLCVFMYFFPLKTSDVSFRNRSHSKVVWVKKKWKKAPFYIAHITLGRLHFPWHINRRVKDKTVKEMTSFPQLSRYLRVPSIITWIWNFF